MEGYEAQRPLLAHSDIESVDTPSVRWLLLVVLPDSLSRSVIGGYLSSINHSTETRWASEARNWACGVAPQKCVVGVEHSIARCHGDGVIGPMTLPTFGKQATSAHV